MKLSRKHEDTFTGKFVSVIALNGCPREIKIGYTADTITPLHAGNFEEMIEELRAVRRALWPEYVEAANTNVDAAVAP